MKQFIIRVDDVGWGVKKRVDHFMQDYEQFHNALASRNLPYCPCIIPSICTETMKAWLYTNLYPSIAPCLHGWSHKPTTTPDSEFGGLTYKQKLERIKVGQYKLYPLKVFGMSAPYNRYDDEVLRAAKETGLEFVFTGYGREKAEWFEKRSDGLWTVPAVEELYLRSGGHSNFLYNLSNLPDRDKPYVVTLHCIWEYPSLNKREFYQVLDELCKHEVIDIRKYIRGE
jgi:peptidoglycan/xylan/chitin deacetylase (PgdA/CDA1 family)